MSSSSTFTPLQFTGISQYSSDFQAILSRNVSIAQIPIMQMTNQVTQIDSEETALGSLNSAVAGVGSALQALGKLGQSQALSASSSDSSVVTATNTGASQPVTYSITNVTSLATAASERSTQGYQDNTVPVSSTGKMQLVYGNNTYNITLASGQNNVQGVAAAINALGVGVTASVLTTGGTNGDYVSVSATTPGATTLQLIDDPTGAATNLITSSNQGTNTNFELNGIPISAPGTTVNNVIPGVTLNFTGKTSSNENVSINLASDPSQIATDLQNLASAYNTLRSQMASQFGRSGGVLSGNNILYQIESAMSSIVQYQGSGSMGNLANLGIEMNQDGTMSFNQQTFNSLSSSQVQSAFALLGSDTSGIGGLQTTFSAITDPVSGTVAMQTAQWNTTTQKLSNQISTKNQQLALLQQTWNQQLQAADASVAELTSQQNTLNASITSMDYVSYGYNTSSTTSKST